MLSLNYFLYYPNLSLRLLSTTDTDDKAIKRTLGYKDGKRAIKVLIEKDPAYIAMAPALANRDYEEIVREYDRQKRVSALESSVNSSFDYIAELEKKYQ